MSAQTQAAGGILPMPAAVLQKPNSNSNGPSSKAGAPRLKLVLRRLAPGLSQAEFEAALGDGWKLRGGKVDWLVYKPGKISKDLSKPSRPSRAYLHLTSQDHLQPLSEKVRDTPFQDAMNTFNDACLIGPPSLEFAPLPKVPLGKKRNDQRQGNIDQDTEFQAFLQSLTDPITKPAPHESESAALPKEMTTTPLIEAIRARKAAKEQAAKDKAAKDKAAKDKAAKAKEGGKVGKEEKATEKGKADRTVKGGTKDTHPEKGKKQSKADKAAREAVKVLNAQAATATASSKTKDTDPDATTVTATAPTPERKRERGNASIAKQMLARDLGLGPAGGRRGRRDQGATTAESNAKPTDVPTGPKAGAAATQSPAVPASSSGPDQPAGKRDNRPTRAERRAHKAAQADSAKSGQQPAANSPTVAPTILKKEPPTPPAAGTASAPSPPTGPAASRAAAPPPTGPRSPSVPASAPSPPAASTTPSTNRHAFLKHANPSQGITEALLHEALSAFGPLEAVEIDKRKGFAYATFATPEALRAAMKGSPVKVAEGAVVVLEKREGGTGGRGQQSGGGGLRGMSPGMRGGGGGRDGGGRGGGHASRGGRGGGAAAGQPATSTSAASSQAGNTT